ncbi:MAG: hypothetical protein WBA10_17055 [Elainellaceae cyanobacterium]
MPQQIDEFLHYLRINCTSSLSLELPFVVVQITSKRGNNGRDEDSGFTTIPKPRTENTPMLSETYYALRARQTGHYLSARASFSSTGANTPGYVLLFSEHADALSYLNAHASDVASRLTVESVSSSQLKDVMARWEFEGVALVKDPLVPDINFMTTAP